MTTLREIADRVEKFPPLGERADGDPSSVEMGIFLRNHAPLFVAVMRAWQADKDVRASISEFAGKDKGLCDDYFRELKNLSKEKERADAEVDRILAGVGKEKA